MYNIVLSLECMLFREKEAVEVVFELATPFSFTKVEIRRHSLISHMVFAQVLQTHRNLDTTFASYYSKPLVHRVLNT